MDLDGDPDIATENIVSVDVSVLLIDGQGGFVAVGTTYATGGEGRSIAVGRLDDDWDLDLLVTNAGPDSVSVLYNLTGELSTGDLNGDGCVGIGDFLGLLSQWSCP